MMMDLSADTRKRFPGPWRDTLDPDEMGGTRPVEYEIAMAEMQGAHCCTVFAANGKLVALVFDELGPATEAILKVGEQFRSE